MSERWALLWNAMQKNEVDVCMALKWKVGTVAEGRRRVRSRYHLIFVPSYSLHHSHELHACEREDPRDRGNEMFA